MESTIPSSFFLLSATLKDWAIGLLILSIIVFLCVTSVLVFTILRLRNNSRAIEIDRKLRAFFQSSASKKKNEKQQDAKNLIENIKLHNKTESEENDIAPKVDDKDKILEKESIETAKTTTILDDINSPSQVVDNDIVMSMQSCQVEERAIEIGNAFDEPIEEVEQEIKVGAMFDVPTGEVADELEQCEMSDETVEETIEKKLLVKNFSQEIDIEENIATDKLIWKVEEVAKLYVADDDAIILKRSMNNKLKFADDNIKEFYNTIKNALMSYKGVKSRMSNVSENFRLKRELLAKITLAGSNLKLFLALDIDSLPKNIYHQKDMSNMDLYNKVPFMVKIRTPLACRKACFLIDEVMKKFELVKNPKYRERDFIVDLVPEANEILAKSRSVITLRENEVVEKLLEIDKNGLQLDLTNVAADVDELELLIENSKTK